MSCIILLTFSLLTVIPWSGQDQTNNICAQKTSITGVVNGINAEDISVNGMTKGIPMYYIPESEKLDPESNVADINLTPSHRSRIKNITTKTKSDVAVSKKSNKVTYNGKQYYIVQITFILHNNGKEAEETKEFLIPESSYICYTEASTRIVSRMSFDALEFMNLDSQLLPA